jgi:hypothetical protein
MKTKILFYRVNEDYGSFSNFAPYPIVLKDKTWPTSEHYFQAQKFSGTEHKEEVRRAKTPMQAALMGRDRKRPLRPDWDNVRDEVMREALEAKVAQHETVRKALLDTGDAELIEHTANDNYWADGGDGSGKNVLGKLVMEIREELRKG